ncbi:MAG: helix-turn-helix domain-containing protein [Mangrovibacterium sp.]
MTKKDMAVIHSGFKKASEHHMGGDNQKISLNEDIIFYRNEVLQPKQIIDSATHPPIRLNAAVFFFCQYGEAHFNVDYQPHRLTKGTLLSLNGRHIIDSVSVPNTYKGFTLILSQDFLLSIFDWIPSLKNSIANSTFNSSPLTNFSEKEQNRLTPILDNIQKKLCATDHHFLREFVKTEVICFLLEVIDIRLKKLENSGTKVKNSRKQELISQFATLVLDHCKEQHEVSFYAQKLCLTPGRLSRFLTKASGKPPTKWINEALIGEAKILLRTPSKSIQEIADELHFGDQSSFGKFFKKHTNFTPIAYRNQLQESFVS